MFMLTQLFQRVHLSSNAPGLTHGGESGYSPPAILRLGWVLGALLLVGAFLGVGIAHAQTGTIAGTVTDAEAGEVLPGANVRVMDTNIGASANAEGRYEITGVEPGTYRLRASFVGFQSKVVEEVTVQEGSTTQVNFRLTPGIEQEEVVVVAYGEQQRRDVTGSISSVDAADIEGTATTSLEMGLQGQIAGVDVTQGDAAPGGGISVQIRGITSTLGTNEPLYVIDGVPLSNSPVSGTQLSSGGVDNRVFTDTNPLSTLSPADIKSIEVLKDASATALYGSRASNGVVLITTKQGEESRGQLNVNYKRSFSTPTKHIDLLDAGQYASYVNEAGFNTNGEDGITFGVDEEAGDPRTPEAIADTVQTIDWQDRVFQVAATDNLGVSYSGGTETGSYSLQGNLLRQQGVIEGAEFLRGGLRANLDREVTEGVQVRGQLNLTRSTNDIVRTSTNNNGAAGGVVRGVQQYPPLAPFRRGECPFDDDRRCLERADNVNSTRIGPNPLRYTDEVKLDQDITRGVANLKTLVDLGNNFILDLSIGGNYNHKGINNYFPSTVAEGETQNGEGTRSSNDFLQIVTENFLRYDNEAGDHEIDALAGVTYEDNNNSFSQAVGRDFPDDEIGKGTLGPAKTTQINSGIQDWVLLSGLSRINYTFKDRYNVTATIRADGSSKFAENNKWGYFPSLGVAWQAIQEPFLEDVDWLSNLKLRASWGVSGNQAISPYASKAQLGLSTTQFDGVITSTAAPQNLPNPNLKWEETTQYNVGLDLAFFDSRLQLTTDVYQKETEDLLQRISLSPNTGFRNALLNSGSIRNRGIEFQVGADILTGNIGWTVSANASRNINEITNLPVEEQFASRLGSGRINFSPFIQREGLPIGAIYGYETNGLYRSQEELQSHEAAPSDAQVGDYRFVDQQEEGEEGFGVINDEDRVVIGDANPDLVWGLTNSFRFGDLSVRILIDSKIGGDIINAQRLRTLRLDGTQGNIPADIYQDAFRPEDYDNPYAEPNPDGEYALPRNRSTSFGRFADVVVEDGSYVRLKNLQIGYTLYDVAYANRARLYVNGTNLWTITGYSGYSPEVSAFGNAARRGVDLGSFPMNRSFEVGVDLTF